MDMSHLSHHMSRLSRGQSAPSTHKSAQTFRVSLGRPKCFLGTLPGHSDHQIPLCDFSLSFFLLYPLKVGKLRAWEIDRKGENSQKCLGEGAKGLLDPGSTKPLAPAQPHFAPVQKQFWVVQKTFRRPLLLGAKRPFCSLP